MDVWAVLWASAQSMIRLVLVTLSGVVATKLGALDSAACSKWGRFVFNVMLPAYLVKTSVQMTDLSTLWRWWPLPVFCALTSAASAAALLLVCCCFRVPTCTRRVVVYSMAFSNVVYVPLSLVEAIVENTTLFDQGANKRGAVYISVYLFAFTFIFWVAGYAYISRNASPNEKAAEEAAQDESVSRGTTHLLAPEPAQSQEQSDSAGDQLELPEIVSSATRDEEAPAGDGEKLPAEEDQVGVAEGTTFSSSTYAGACDGMRRAVDSCIAKCCTPHLRRAWEKAKPLLSRLANPPLLAVVLGLLLVLCPPGNACTACCPAKPTKLLHSARRLFRGGRTSEVCVIHPEHARGRDSPMLSHHARQPPLAGTPRALQGAALR
eukprot:TRINITY_DN3784_c0_g1_i4.p1 TRINITY_DN3784_c0_g1~~TRINITY_DN3784_c0_g1_i4.p1  ORF type:complete len:378 (+),score=62.88 TRINITY_DN3784_c0_g1_i4:804-1937(+)